MRKQYIKFIFILIICLVYLYAFSASSSSHNIDELAYVIALGIDSSQNDNLKVTFQFVKPSSTSQDSSSEDIVTIENSVDASSIDTAINLMNGYMGKELNLSHCKLIVFSEEVAKNGISTQIYSLINNEEIRPSANIIISKCDANEYILNSKPILDKLPSRYYETFFVSNSFTGFTDDITIGEFYNKLVCTTCNSTAILGNIQPKSSEDSSESSDDSSSDNSSENLSSNKTSNDDNLVNNDPNIQASTDNSNNNSNAETSSDITSDKNSIIGEETSENFGLAVFKRDKLVGELSSFETVCHLIVSNNIEAFVISVNSPSLNGDYIDLSLSQAKKTKINVDLINGTPYISVDVFISGKILTVDENSDYSNDDILLAIEENASSYLENLLYDYLYKTSKEFESDIDGFGKYATSSFLTDKDWLDFNWYSRYKDSFFKVNVSTDIESSLLLTSS